MKNYLNLLLESERNTAMFAKLKETKYGFLSSAIFAICFYSFIIYNFFGGSPDTFTVYSLLAFMMSPVKNADKLLVQSLPLTAIAIRKWNLQIHGLYLALLLPFSFILYFISPMTKSDPLDWFVAGNPSVTAIAVGYFTGILLNIALRFFIDLEPFRFIKIRYCFAPEYASKI